MIRSSLPRWTALLTLTLVALPVLPVVVWTNPELPSSPDHERARRLLDGFGGMLAFEPAGGPEAADAVLANLRLVTPSVGGVERLATPPATTSHAKIHPEERRELGVRDELGRVSVGIKAAEDLLADFHRALD